MSEAATYPSDSFKRIRRLLRIARFRDWITRNKVTPLKLRANMEQNFAGREPKGVQFIEVDAGGVPSAWLVPEGYDGNVRVLHLHGGGYAGGDINTHRCYAGCLAQVSGAAVLVPHYRLAPEDPFPAALDDGLAAWRYLLASGPEGAGQAQKNIIGGDSAGGGLSLAVMMALRDAGEQLPDGASLLSPWADLVCEGPRMKNRSRADLLVAQDWLKACAEVYGVGVDHADPRLSPVNGDFSGLPPIDIQVGDAEVLLGDSELIVERAKAAGVNVTCEVWPEMLHIWQVLWPFIPESQQSIEKTSKFIHSLA